MGHGAPKQFFTTVKQHGALLAKGRMLGVQFDTLFTDGLYMEICKNANIQAEKVCFGFREKKDDNHTVMRIATSWATTDEDVAALLALL